MLNEDSKLIELSIKVVIHKSSEFRLYVSDLNDSNSPDEVSNAFFRLLLKKFLKSIGSKLIQKVLAVFFQRFRSANMESDTNINSDFNVISGRTVEYRRIISYRVLCDHCCYGVAPCTEAAMISWL